MLLKDHRELILAALHKAVDACILQDIEQVPDGVRPIVFHATIEISYRDSPIKVVCHPALDLSKDPISSVARIAD